MFSAVSSLPSGMLTAQLPPSSVLGGDLGASAGRVRVQPSLPRAGNARYVWRWFGRGEPYTWPQSWCFSPLGVTCALWIGRQMVARETDFPISWPGSVNPLENLSKAIKPLPWKVHIHRHPWICTFQRVLDSMKTIHGSLVLAVPTFPTSSQYCSYHAIAPRHHCCHFLNVPYSSTLPYFCICSLSAICFSSLSL